MSKPTYDNLEEKEEVIDDGSDIFEGADLTKSDSEDEKRPSEIKENESEEETGEDTKPPEGEESETKEDTYTVKYNGKDVSLSLDELKTNAQKGLNYDKVKGELDALKSSDALRLVDELAASAGVPVDDYVRNVRREMQQNEINSLAETEGVNEDVAGELYEARKVNAEREAASNAEKENRERLDKMFTDFQNRFPGVGPEDVPPEVWDKVREGEDLSLAYAMHKNEGLTGQNKDYKNQIDRYEQNKKNEQSAAGAISGKNGADYDAFLDGLSSK